MCNDDHPRVWVDSEKPAIEQRVQIGAKQQTVRCMVRRAAEIRRNVCCFKYVLDGATRNYAAAPVGFQQRRSESRLTAPDTYRPECPFPQVLYAIRIEAGIIRLLATDRQYRGEQWRKALLDFDGDVFGYPDAAALRR